jgi:hypothetical protein
LVRSSGSSWNSAANRARVRWRGEELDRLDAMHASIVERLVEILTSLGWECAVEVTFWIRREQGSADVLAWHPPTGRLLVVETKSVVPDLQTMLSSLDRKVRLGPAIAAQRLARDRRRQDHCPRRHGGEPRAGRTVRRDSAGRAASGRAVDAALAGKPGRALPGRALVLRGHAGEDCNQAT